MWLCHCRPNSAWWYISWALFLSKRFASSQSVLPVLFLERHENWPSLGLTTQLIIENGWILTVMCDIVLTYLFVVFSFTYIFVDTKFTLFIQLFHLWMHNKIIWMKIKVFPRLQCSLLIAFSRSHYTCYFFYMLHQ